VRVLLDVSAVPDRPVGAGRYVLALVGELATRDLDLHLVARAGDVARWEALAPRATVHPDVPVARGPRLVWEQVGARRLVRRVGPDVWHGPHYTLPLRVDVPAVVTVHDTTFLEHPEWHERTKALFFPRMIRAAVTRAAAIVAVSAATGAGITRLLHPTAPVVVAPHGVDHERFHPTRVPDDDGDLAALALIGVRPPYVAFTGTLEPRKDLPSLVAAFARLAPDRPDLRLVLAGPDGWGTAAVRTARARSGVATSIVRPGYLTEDAVPALFRRAAVVAYPSLEEGFGMPALEALACGAPLVTTAGTAMAEFATGAALLVPPNDPDAIATAIARILDDPVEAARLRTAGPVAAAEATWARSADRHVEAYRLAAGDGVPAGRAAA
jgi:glycosyltransferase involved in cell wall biosynthesis